jgi:hypothetical protein
MNDKEQQIELMRDVMFSFREEQYFMLYLHDKASQEHINPVPTVEDWYQKTQVLSSTWLKMRHQVPDNAYRKYMDFMSCACGNTCDPYALLKDYWLGDGDERLSHHLSQHVDDDKKCNM